MGTLGEIVKPTFITVAPEDTLGEVAERMSAQNVGSVVVKDFGRLIGILTERDMLRAMAARVHTSDARVRQWMTEDPITAPRT
jgi:CBS domain-containing protein